MYNTILPLFGKKINVKYDKKRCNIRSYRTFFLKATKTDKVRIIQIDTAKIRIIHKRRFKSKEKERSHRLRSCYIRFPVDIPLIIGYNHQQEEIYFCSLVTFKSNVTNHSQWLITQ